jgi:hypothetical protein
LTEMGTHDELVQIEGGKYAHLFKLQSEGYADLNNEKKKGPLPPMPATQFPDGSIQLPSAESMARGT